MAATNNLNAVLGHIEQKALESGVPVTRVDLKRTTVEIAKEYGAEIFYSPADPNSVVRLNSNATSWGKVTNKPSPVIAYFATAFTRESGQSVYVGIAANGSLVWMQTLPTWKPLEIDLSDYPR